MITNENGEALIPEIKCIHCGSVTGIEKTDERHANLVYPCPKCNRNMIWEIVNTDCKWFINVARGKSLRSGEMVIAEIICYGPNKRVTCDGCYKYWNKESPSPEVDTNQDYKNHCLGEK